jgi:hypothetical protein
MTPGEFLKTIAEPNINEFLGAQTDMRRAINAIHSIDDLVGQIHVWAKANAPGAMAASDDDNYRDHLSNDEEFGALRDMAAALKHGELCRPKKPPRLVIRSVDLKATQRAFDISGFQANAFQTESKAAWVDLTDGREFPVSHLLGRSLWLLEQEMISLGCTA